MMLSSYWSLEKGGDILFIIDANRLRDLLVEHKTDIIDVARQIGITPQTLARLAQRDRPCRLRTIGKIAAALGVDYRQLLKEA